MTFVLASIVGTVSVVWLFGAVSGRLPAMIGGLVSPGWLQ